MNCNDCGRAYSPHELKRGLCHQCTSDLFDAVLTELAKSIDFVKGEIAELFNNMDEPPSSTDEQAFKSVIDDIPTDIDAVIKKHRREPYYP